MDKIKNLNLICPEIFCAQKIKVQKFYVQKISETIFRIKMVVASWATKGLHLVERKLG